MSRYIVTSRNTSAIRYRGQKSMNDQMHDHGHGRDGMRERGRGPGRGPGSGGPWAPRFFEQLRAGAPAMRRGEIRPLILGALAQKPMHGYEVIQELESQSGGRWRPSAGSVYPTLQQLEDEGMVTSQEVDGRRTYTLTDAGRASVAAAPSSGSRWSHGPDREPDIRALAVQLVGAVVQVQRMGSPAAKQEARTVLTEARRRMYRLLAEDEDPSANEAARTDGARTGPAESDARGDSPSNGSPADNRPADANPSGT
jgi:DNA-binding PadR family transcriptional regulator